MPADASYIAAARSGTYPVRHGNLVRPLVDGVPAFRRICAAVASADRRVWATIAFVDRTVLLPDGHGTVFDLLDRAAARVVDDVWTTVGSANLEGDSLERATEMNVVCWDSGVASALRRDLLGEHGVDTASVAALHDGARGGRSLLVALDPAQYAA